MRRGATAVGACTLIALLGACGGSSEPSAVRVIAAAADATTAEHTARVATTLNTRLKAADAPHEPRTMRLDGVIDFRSGDSELTTQSSGADTGWSEERVVDGVSYTRGPDLVPEVGRLPGQPLPPEQYRRRWVKHDPQHPGEYDSLAVPSAFVVLGGLPLGAPSDPSTWLDALRGIGSVERVGQETIRGAETTKYHVTFDVEKLLAQLPAARRESLREEKTSPPAPDVWVDEEGRVRRIAYEYSDSEAEFSFETDLFDFGVNVHVVAPPADEIIGGESAPGLLDPPPNSAPPG